MLKGIIVAYFIILISIPIPIVHFFTIPVSPFVAGFIGGGLAEADDEKIVYFGLIIAGLMALPAFFIGFLALLSKVELIKNTLYERNLSGFSVTKLKFDGTWSGVTGKCAPSI